MSSSLRTSASGMLAQQRMIDVIANNLANVNTTGFKRSRVSFEDVLYETVRPGASATSPAGGALSPIQIGKGVRVAAVLRLHAEGSPEQTGRALDVAIEGDGFFQVQRADGTTGYTRDGGFTLSEDGRMVTIGGEALLPEIVVPEGATNLGIGPTGVVSVTLPGSATPMELGRIEVVRFLNPAGLLALGGNQYGESPATGRPLPGFPGEDGSGRLMQGALESSNVEIVQEMTDMIAAQRAYEINAKAVRAGEDMMQATRDLIR
jgi:flagellar basal-body rod protein FlgG